MHVFVTGASGWVASALIPELIAAGHSVTGLARSDVSIDEVERRGATAVRGSLADLDLICAQAAASDGVIHLAFPHDNMLDLNAAARSDRGVLEAIVDALAGSDKPFIVASGTPTVIGRASTEADDMAPDGPNGGRAGNERFVRDSGGRGVRTAAVRLPRSVHGAGDRHGFIAQLASAFATAGTGMYVGDGTTCWCAVHVRDAAHLFRLALENAPAGSALHAVGDEGIEVKVIAQALADRMDLPVSSVESDALGFLGMLQVVDHTTTAAWTREVMGWQPTHPNLLADIAAGVYDR